MEIFLIRHGETKDNIEKRYTGRRQTMLTEKGEYDAEILAMNLEHHDIRTVVCSPLIRAMQTAQALCFNWGVLEADFDENWIEMDFGIASGLTYEEFKEKDSTAVEGWAKDWFGYTLPEGENGEEVFERVKNGIESILNRNFKNDKVAIVTHLGCIRFALSYLLHGSHEKFWDYSINNADYAHIRVADGKVEAVRMP